MNEVLKQVEELQREKQARETGNMEVEVESVTETENDEIEIKEEKPKGDIEVQEEPEEQKVSSETKEEKAEYLDEGKDKEKYSKMVQKRIDEYAYQLGESRRREEEAIQIAQAIKEERDKIKAQLNQSNEGYFTEFGGRLSNSMEAAKAKLKKAMEDQDYEAVAQAQMDIGRLGAEQARYDTMKQERERLAKNPVNEQEEVQIPKAPQQPVKDPKAEAWALQNEWFGTDKVMTTVAVAIHDELLNEGIDPRTDIYYSEIDKRMRSNLPHKFNGQNPVEEEAPAVQQPVQTVASANRNRGTGRNVVKLSSTELHMAKRLNLTPEQYAKEKLKLQNRR